MSVIDVATVINSLQLTAVALNRVELVNHQDENPLAPGAEVKWTLETNLAYRQTSPTELRIKATARIQYQPESPQPFDLLVEIVGSYAASAPISGDEIPALVNTHSLPLLWPYLREIISDLTTRIGGPVVTIPTLQINLNPPAAEAPSEPEAGRKRAKRARKARGSPSEQNTAPDP